MKKKQANIVHVFKIIITMKTLKINTFNTKFLRKTC
jgi:hypothetical protein